MSAPDTLADAREDFKRHGDLARLAVYLEVALDAWNEEDLSERDFAAEIRTAKNYCELHSHPSSMKITYKL